MHELIMHEAVFEAVKRFLESSYSLRVFQIPSPDPETTADIISYGVAPTELLKPYIPQRLQPTPVDTHTLSEWIEHE